METLTLAQIIGPTFLAAGIGFLLHLKFYKKMIDDFEKNQGLTYITGIMIMILGFIVVLNHNIWGWNAAGIITFLGWASIVKGAIFLTFPSLPFAIAKPVLNNAMIMKVAMVAMVLVGGYLSYYGYFMM
ncbi:MAG: hypothetical protein PHO48_02470 [Candidatus Gracilibacteria bacterium]|nr:hypothetical protein [Candidatus Gracilibacteria bacterium]MDD5178645.1 hypothetical protein [Candidatus Gracilibacteria bacterium]